MPSIPQKLRDSAIGLLNTGMTMNAVAMNTGCSTRAIRHLRERFQATGRTEDRPCRGLPVIEVMAGFEYIVGEMNVMPTIAYLNEIVLGGGGSVLVLAGIAHGFRTNLVVIEENLNAQRYRDEILVKHVIRLFQNQSVESAGVAFVKEANILRNW